MPKSLNLFRFGLYELDPVARELRKNGTRVKLQDQPVQVLIALLERPQQIVTREELRLLLWPSDTFVDFDHSLNTAINKLREALGDTATNPRFIETLPRRGYRFVAPVNSEAPANAEPDGIAQADPEQQHVDHIPLPPRRVTRTLFGLLQLMYLIFYCVALWKLSDAGSRAEDFWRVPSFWIETALLVTGVLGVPLRLYTLAATAFDYRLFATKYRVLFPLLFAMDFFWALTPLLLAAEIGIGLAVAACAVLFYSPFAQRMLVRMAWERHEAPRASAVSR
jgi:cholera toxin transcriptional activator